MTDTHPNDWATPSQIHIIEAGQPDRRVAVRGIVTIGRGTENDIVLESPTVSYFHAVLLCDATGVLLIDLESTNGTQLNGVWLSPDTPARLANEDRFQIGQVLVRYTVLTMNAAWHPAPHEAWAPS